MPLGLYTAYTIGFLRYDEDAGNQEKMNIFTISIASFILIYILVCIGVKTFQNRFIFTLGPNYSTNIAPSDIGLEYEEVWIENQKSESRINGWWTPVSSEATILYLHGNSTSLIDHLEVVQLFNSRGWNSLIIDYPKFGKSEGKFPTELSVYEDAASAWEYLVKQKHISPNKIMVYGHSLGGAIAIEMATRYPEMAGAIVESSFTSIMDMAKKRIYRFFPLKLILDQEFNSIEKVKRLSVPILFMHGKKDSLVPFQMTVNLFEETSSPHKNIVLFEDGRHWNLKMTDNNRYIESITKFIDRKDA